MSPALMDSGASSHILHLQSVHPTRNPNPNGQISHSPLFDFSEFRSKEKMKSSNAGNRASGFPNSSEIDQNISFSSRVMPRSGSDNAAFGLSSGVSKPRLGKARRHLNSQHPRSSNAAPETRVGPGFNPFRPIPDVSFVRKPSGGDDASVFGASRINPSLNRNPDNEILDGMRKLKIANENVGSRAGSNFSEGLVDKDFVFGNKNLKTPSFDESVASELPNEMRKLNIEAEVNRECFDKSKDSNFESSVTDKAPFTFQSGTNVGGSLGRSMGFQRPNEPKKLTTDVYNGNVTFDANDANKFLFGSHQKGIDSFPGSSSSTLHDQMRNLKIAESVNANVLGKEEVHNEPINKNRFPFGSTGSARGYFSGMVENTLSDDMRKMEIRDGVGDTSSQTTNEKLGGKKFQNVGNLIPTEFTFQAGTNVKNLSGSRGPLEQSNDGINMKGNPGTSSLSSHDIHLQAYENVFQAPSMDKSEKHRFSFTSKLDERGTPHVDFSTPNPNVDLFSGFNQKVESAKRATFSDKRVKRRKEKLKHPNPNQRWLGHDFVLRESSSQENPEASEPYSPMDVSPYQETLADHQFSREASETSVESIHFDNSYASTDSHQTVSNDVIDEDLVVATQGLNINVDDLKDRETEGEGDEGCFDQGVGAGGSLEEESVSGAESEGFKSLTEQFDSNSDTTATSAEGEVSLTSDIDKQDNDSRQQFCFASSSEDVGNTNFTFAASFSGQGQSAAAMRYHKKKNRIKVAPDSYDSAPNLKVAYASSSVQLFPLSSNSPVMSHAQGQKGNISTSLYKGRNNIDSTEVDKQQETKQEFNPAAATLAVQEACEKWRLRYLLYAIFSIF